MMDYPRCVGYFTFKCRSTNRQIIYHHDFQNNENHEGEKGNHEGELPQINLLFRLCASFFAFVVKLLN